MKFHIDFNRIYEENSDKILEQLGAKEESLPENGEFLGYFVEIDDLNDLRILQKRIHELTKTEYTYMLLLDMEEEGDYSIYIDDVNK